MVVVVIWHRMRNMVQKLSKEQYDDMDVAILFSEEYSRSYGSITIDSKTFKFSWQSTLIEPQIEHLKPGVVGIGIDQHFCLLDSSSGKYLTLLLFPTSFI